MVGVVFVIIYAIQVQPWLILIYFGASFLLTMLTSVLSKKVKLVGKQKGKYFYQIGETYGSYDLINSYITSGMIDGQFDFNMYDNAFTNIPFPVPPPVCSLSVSSANITA